MRTFVCVIFLGSLVVAKPQLYRQVRFQEHGEIRDKHEEDEPKEHGAPYPAAGFRPLKKFEIRNRQELPHLSTPYEDKQAFRTSLKHHHAPTNEYGIPRERNEDVEHASKKTHKLVTSYEAPIFVPPHLEYGVPVEMVEIIERTGEKGKSNALFRLKELEDNEGGRPKENKKENIGEEKKTKIVRKEENKENGNEEKRESFIFFLQPPRFNTLPFQNQVQFKNDAYSATYQQQKSIGIGPLSYYYQPKLQQLAPYVLPYSEYQWWSE